LQFLQKLYKIENTLTPEDKKEITTMMQQVDAKMEEQNEIIVGIMDVVESHTKIINQLEEEIKKLKKSPKS
jgi:hypothetical protein